MAPGHYLGYRKAMLSYKPVFVAAAVLCWAGCGAPYARPEPSQKDCDGGQVEDCKAKCDQNVPRACYRLGWFTENGEAGVKQNPKRAVELYERACQGDMAVACRALGVVYKTGTSDIDRSKKRSRHFFQRACDLGMPEVCPPPEEEGERESSGGQPSGDASVSVDVKLGGE